MISGVSKVVLDVEDQDRAREFWTTVMGFELVQDTPYGEGRWLEVRSPDRATILVLGRSATGPGDRAAVPPELPTSNLMFRCEDLAATYRSWPPGGWRSLSRPCARGSAGRALFADSEGNRFALTPAGQ